MHVLLQIRRKMITCYEGGKQLQRSTTEFSKLVKGNQCLRKQKAKINKILQNDISVKFEPILSTIFFTFSLLYV